MKLRKLKIGDKFKTKDNDELLTITSEIWSDDSDGYPVQRKNATGADGFEYTLRASLEVERIDSHPLQGGSMPSVVNKQELWNWQVGAFNFEFNSDQILEKALKSGFVTKIKGEKDFYLVNADY